MVAFAWLLPLIKEHSDAPKALLTAFDKDIATARKEKKLYTDMVERVNQIFRLGCSPAYTSDKSLFGEIFDAIIQYQLIETTYLTQRYDQISTHKMILTI